MGGGDVRYFVEAEDGRGDCPQRAGTRVLGMRYVPDGLVVVLVRAAVEFTHRPLFESYWTLSRVTAATKQPGNCKKASATSFPYPMLPSDVML